MSQRYQGGFITASYNGLKVPDAPTIGTATGGNASASVTFTAPANVGGGAITGFTVISSPSGITGTGASSPITVSGLSNGTPYTFTVVATNAYGTGPVSASSNSTSPQAPPTVIGQAYGGGYYGGKINVSSTQYYLIVADKTVGETQGAWGTNSVFTGVTSVINGPANTTALAALGSAYAAATFCENLNSGGYTDWYMPALNEFEVLYYFLKIDNTANNTSSGSNANAVSPEPISTNYSSGSPSQTTATNFRLGASSQEFAAYTYWVSTDVDASTAWQQSVNTGHQANGNPKQYSNYTRAVRRVAV